MKKYKNIWLSISSYLMAVLWFVLALYLGDLFIEVQKSNIITNILNKGVLIVLFILLLLGIFFGLRSNKSEESSWIGNLLSVIGIVLIITYTILMSGIMI